VTVITPGAGCSITSTATVSIAGAADGFTFRATFFTDAGLGLALATGRFVAFAALAALRALPRLAEFPLRSFARFCTFDAFLRLAMIDPLVLRNDTTVQVAARYQTRVITRFPLERDRLGAILPRSNCASESADEVKRQQHAASPGGSTARTMPSKNTARIGDEGKAVGCVPPTALLF
jgi:hypothetical protein